VKREFVDERPYELEGLNLIEISKSRSSKVYMSEEDSRSVDSSMELDNEESQDEE
jgi:hypothetical protein